MDATCPFYDFCNNFPTLRHVVRNFSDTLIRAHTTKQQLFFLRECRDEHVIPNSVLPNRIVQLADRPFDEIQRAVLNKQIRIKLLENNTSHEVLLRNRQRFDAIIPPEWKDRLLDFCYHKMRRVVYQDLKQTHNNRLNLLISRSDWTKDASEDCIVNLSDKVLDRNSVCALGYGLNFASSVKPINNVEVAKSVNNLEKFSDLTSEDIGITKGIIYHAMQMPNIPNCPKRFSKAINALKKDDSLHITKADKSSAVVIMNKGDYIEKMENLLSDENTYKQLQRNPLESVNSQFNKKVKSLLRDRKDLIQKVFKFTPSLPYMYGLIKTHKPNNPARPIISSVGSASYNLSKYLVSILNPLVGAISNSNIKNNVDLTEKLNSLNMSSDFKLVSFDVVSLFTKVPIDDLLEMLPEELENFDLPFSSDTLIELIKLCVKDSKFEFNGKYYSQNFGMAMGNPLSPVLSNLYMELFEKKILNRILPRNVVWFRYVDDIICIWPNNLDENVFLMSLNDLVPSIKFTMELEQNSSLPFLDVLIHRVDRKFKFSIYRKPTNIQAYVHYYSAHSRKVKLSIFSSMFLRALRICSPEYLDEEIEYIMGIGAKLKYPQDMLQTSLKKARKTFYNTNEVRRPFDTKNLLVLPYNENFKNLPLLLKSFGVNVAFKNTTTVKASLIKNSPDTIPGVVYRIPCKECNKTYIGQTGKGSELRKKQHKTSIRNGNTDSGIFLHVRDFGHPVDWENSSDMLYCNNFQGRNIIESSFIKQSWGENMNVKPGLYKLDPFIIKRIGQQYNFDPSQCNIKRQPP